MLVWLLACAGDDKDDTATPAGDTDADTDTDTDADADTDTDTDTAPEPTASLAGTVLDTDGDPVEGARVNVCRAVCVVSFSDAAGAYSFPELEPWTAAFYTIPPADSDYASPIVPLTLADDEDRAIDVVLPELEGSARLPSSAEEVEVADGVWLTIGDDNLQPPAAGELGDVVAGVEVPEAWRLPIELAGTVIDVWYLVPFEALSEDGVPVRVENRWDLAPGTTVEVWSSGDALTYAWVDEGSLTVTGDGAMLEGDARLHFITTMVLVGE